MELQGERLIPASVDTTWAALNDPDTLKACIAGCESLERTGDDAFSAVVALKVGPVSARFKGNLQMTNVQAPNGYTINFDGQGGVAGFGKGSADVALSPDGANTLLKYNARATVGGKMAQVGARLIDAAAGKITEDFFKAFEAQLQAAATPAATQPVASAAPAPAEPARGGGIKTVWWLIGAVIVLAAIYVLIKK
ncbi:MAG TPA: carbon monoxide dehydrogenase subunit G [Burkholderiaceae bacterium]|nr:carbon monoxide dehydrogenase subunit G [Burkholderiaceae bacterium]